MHSSPPPRDMSPPDRILHLFPFIDPKGVQEEKNTRPGSSQTIPSQVGNFARSLYQKFLHFLSSDKKFTHKPSSLFLSCVLQELGGVLGDNFWADGMRLKVQILATRKLELETAASLKITELEDSTCTKCFPLESQPNHFTVTHKWKM